MEQTPKTHSLTLTDRKILTMTGVEQITRFEDTAVVAQTGLGSLVVTGRELKLRKLSPDGGQVAVEGQITGLDYEEPRAGFLRRILG